MFDNDVLLEAALNATLDALPRPAFIVKGGHDVVRQNRAGRDFAAHAGDVCAMLRNAILAPSESPAFDVTPLEAGEATYHLAVARERVLSTSERLDMAKASWRLTPREADVVGLLVQGLPNKLIADRLTLTLGTTALFVTLILRKAGAANRCELIARFWTEAFSSA